MKKMRELREMIELREMREKLQDPQELKVVLQEKEEIREDNGLEKEKIDNNK